MRKGTPAGAAPDRQALYVHRAQGRKGRALDDGLVLSSDQNVMKLGFDGLLKYFKYYPAPRQPALLFAPSSSDWLPIAPDARTLPSLEAVDSDHPVMTAVSLNDLHVTAFAADDIVQLVGLRAVARLVGELVETVRRRRADLGNAPRVPAPWGHRTGSPFPCRR